MSLGSLVRSRGNPRVLLPNAIWQIDITHYPAFGNLRYVHAMMDSCSAFICVVAMTGEKFSHAVKAMESAMLVMGGPWALKTDDGTT